MSTLKQNVVTGKELHVQEKSIGGIISKNIKFIKLKKYLPNHILKHWKVKKIKNSFKLALIIYIIFSFI